MFEIEVFSNPLNAVVGEGRFLRHDDYPQTARYDEELVKPALLLADGVTLRSHRIDLLRGEQRDFEMANRFVPLTSQYIYLSASPDREAMAFLGLSEADLLSPDEVEHYQTIRALETADRDRVKSRPMPTNVDALRAQRAADRAELSKYDVEWEKLQARAEPMRRALRRRHAEAAEAFQSQALSDIASSGLLKQVAWDPLPKSRPRQVIDNLVGENAEFERAFHAMVDDVVGTPNSVMLDDEVNSAIARLSPQADGLESALVIAGAVDLMRMVEGVSSLPIDEIPGVRDELSDYLKPFRSFVIEVSRGVDWAGVDDSERGRLLQIAWEADVQPAVAEMEAHVRSASFVRNAIDVFADSRDTFTAVGLALGTVAASGFLGFSTLTATAAAGPPLLKALLGSVRARETAKRNRAYLVHALPRTKAVKRAVRASRS